MKKSLKDIFFIIFLLIITLNCTKPYNKDKGDAVKYSRRVITLAPAITEIVYALDAGCLIVGNTKFCNYPPNSKKKIKVGGYLDINTEMILKLNPDLVISYPEHRESLKIIGHSIKILIVQHITVADILKSINTIGEALNKKVEAFYLIKSIEKELYKNQNIITKKKILFIAGRDSESLKTMSIIGNKGFLNELLKLSGGENVYKGNIPYPSVSMESVTSMNPEIILEFSFYINKRKQRKALKLWERYPMIDAVKNKKIFILTEDYWQKPGPRIINIVRKLKKLIN